jgi:hypothetical protein
VHLLLQVSFSNPAYCPKRTFKFEMYAPAGGIIKKNKAIPVTGRGGA